MTPRASKFAIPPPPSSYVERPRLETRLDAAVHARLTVISGRAGSGKTALLANWIATIDRADSAWLTFDDDDNEAAIFWNDVDTIRRHLENTGRGPLAAAPETRRDAFVVLDDVDALTAPDALRNFAEFVTLAPAWMHLVVACRGAAPLSLWRIRSAGELATIGDDELRLTRDETTALTVESNLTTETVDSIHETTDGWLTGVRLMSTPWKIGSVEAVAVAGRFSDPIRDFFLDEVLAPQPPDVQTFLMETSWLDPLTPGLCESVTKRPDAADILHRLDRANAFVTRTPLTAGTYRCHPQFQAVLRDEHQARDPDRIATIHTAAAEWYEAHGDPQAAIEHFLAAGSVGAAARLLPEARFAPRDDPRNTAMRALLANTHPAMSNADAWQLLDYATVLAAVDDGDAVRETIDQVDAVLRFEPDDAAAFRANYLRGLSRLAAGDVEGMVAGLEAAQTIFDANPALAHDARLDMQPRLAQLHAWLAHGYRWLGRSREARRALARTPAAAIDRRDLHFRDSARATIEFASGHLVVADRLASRAIERAAQLGLDDDVTVYAARLVNATIMYERDDLAGARAAYTALIDPADRPGAGLFAIRAQVQLTEVLRAESDVSTALESLFRLRQQRVHRPGSAVDNMLARATVHCLLAIDRIDAARITLGRTPYPQSLLRVAALVELADDAPDAAAAHLARMRIDTPRRLLWASLLSARIAAARGDDGAVDRSLRRALRIGRREGFVRTVAQLAPALLDRMNSLCTGAEESEYVARLRRTTGRAVVAVDTERSTTLDTNLTRRELEVLSYLATQLSAREIAAALYVSRNTLKTHMRSVYRKLGCDSRETVVEQARRLQLLH